MTPDDERYMKVALDEARRAMALDEVPIGAVVVCRGRIIARAHNLTETLTDVTAHAEMQAITAAANYLGGKYLTDCTLYVTVEPCLMCAGAIAHAQVETRLVEEIVDYSFSYPMMNDVMRIVKEMSPRIVAQTYDNTCTIRLAIRRSEADRLRARLAKLSF